MENLGDVKIKVNNEVESKEAQELFFELGCGWYYWGKVVNYTDAPYIYRGGKYLCYGYNEETFNTEKVKEVTLQEMREMIQQQQQQKELQQPSAVEQQATTKHSDEFIEQRTKIFSKHLQGVKYQYRYNDQGQWHNLTEKSLHHILKPNVVFREKPLKVTIDGILFDKDAAIKYIQKHY